MAASVGAGRHLPPPATNCQYQARCLSGRIQGHDRPLPETNCAPRARFPGYSRTGLRGSPPAGVGITVPVSGWAGSSQRIWVAEPTAETKTILPSASQPGSATFAGFGDKRVITPVATVNVKSATSPSRVEMNAIVFPSGLHAGSTSVVAPFVSDLSVPSDNATSASDALPNCVVTTTSVSADADQLGLASTAVEKPALPVAATGLLPSIPDVQRWSDPLSVEMNASVAPFADTDAWSDGEGIVGIRVSVPPASGTV